jgi:hypothetical protein
MTLGLALVLEFDSEASLTEKRSKAIGLRFRGDNGPFGGKPQGSSGDRPITLTLSHDLRGEAAQLWPDQDHRISNDYIA